MSRRPWHRARLGIGAWREVGSDRLVTVRVAHDGGVRIVVSRYVGAGVYALSHSRHVAWLTYSPRRGADA